MKPIEDQLRSLTFRAAPNELRDAIYSPLSSAPQKSWRDWFYPSPLAWAAMAAVWLMLFAVNLTSTKEQSISNKLSPEARSYYLSTYVNQQHQLLLTSL